MRAPAKINLSLHLLARRQDGYHTLESLVAFAGIGDSLEFMPAAEADLSISGPFAHNCGQSADNLILKAENALKSRIPELKTGTFALNKRLPVASGMGGGSADAAAALRLLAAQNAIALDDPRILEAARAIGADVTVCLDSKARMMRGIGEILDPPLQLPPLFAVLVNPGISLSTSEVFAKIGLKPGENAGFGPHPVISTTSFEETIRGLKRARNDMEDAACVLAPVISHVLNVLMAARGCRLARMSGSGATCFAVFETCRQAAAAAKVIRRDHLEWWVKATVLR